MKKQWIQDEARVKRELIDLLRREPRARWVEAIMAKYGGTAEGRVATFLVFCAMEHAGELDELKADKSARNIEVTKSVWRRLPKARLTKTVGLALTLTLAALFSATADDNRRERREHHNWILERQEAGQVSGVPTTRRIIGNREIDVYPDGSMFEKNNYVGRAK